MSIWQTFLLGRQPARYAPGEMIYLQGTKSEAFYYLISGTARSFLSSPEGEEQVLTLHRGGSLMGEASFFDGCLRVSSAMALTECQAVAVTWPQLEQALSQEPQLAIPMMRHLAHTVGQLSRQVNALSFQSAESRLAAQVLGARDGKGRVAVTQEELGYQIGASRVTVARILRSWAGQGWVTTGYGVLEIHDPASLEERAKAQ